MTLTEPVIRTRFAAGELRFSLAGGPHLVGDRRVPSRIELDLPGANGQPALLMVVEVVNGVPRLTELTLRRNEGGREIRQKDLRAIEVDRWVEDLVAACAGQVVPRDDGVLQVEYSVDTDSALRARRTIQDARKGSRRPLTDDRKRRVAEVYNAHESGGIEAVQLAFEVSRSTAIRYVNAARAAGLVEQRAQR